MDSARFTPLVGSLVDSLETLAFIVALDGAAS
jgi:hypothetical protein